MGKTFWEQKGCQASCVRTDALYSFPGPFHDKDTFCSGARHKIGTDVSASL